jgi:hypothetical protein
MRVEKICANIHCQKTFFAVNSVQNFCCRRCFKIAYHARMKEKKKLEKANPIRAHKTCDFCRREYVIPFDVVRYPKKFDEWSCPHCGVPNEMIWRNQNNTNSHQIIFSAIIQMRSGNVGTTYSQVITFD